MSRSKRSCRAFVRRRGAFGEHTELAQRLDEVEKCHDKRFKDVFDAIRALMEAPSGPHREIGFRPPTSGRRVLPRLCVPPAYFRLDDQTAERAHVTNVLLIRRSSRSFAQPAGTWPV